MAESQDMTGTSTDEQTEVEVLPTRNTRVTKRRKDWLENNEKIRQALLSYWKDHKRPPTNKALAKIAGVTEATVENHFRETDFEFYYEHLREKYSVLSEDIFMSIVNSALKGTPKAQEMALQIIHNWSKPMEMTLKDETDQTPKLTASTDDLDTHIDNMIALRAKIQERKAQNSKKADTENPSGDVTQTEVPAEGSQNAGEIPPERQN